MTIVDASLNALLLSIPALIYALVVRLRHKLDLFGIVQRLGLGPAPRRFLGIALLASIPVGAVAVLVSSRTSGFEGSMLAPFLNQPPSAVLLAQAFFYAFVATGIPEELLFRGLIAGALFRAFAFWPANVAQAIIFTVPHLLILLVNTTLWPIAIALPLGLGLFLGWLRKAGASIWPSAWVHAMLNFTGAIWVMNWS